MTISEQQISLRYFAILREQAGRENEDIRTSAANARELYRELHKRYSFTLPEDRVSVAINNNFCSLDQSLSPGDCVVFIPPVAGG